MADDLKAEASALARAKLLSIEPPAKVVSDDPIATEAQELARAKLKRTAAVGAAAVTMGPSVTPEAAKVGQQYEELYGRPVPYAVIMQDQKTFEQKVRAAQLTRAMEAAPATARWAAMLDNGSLLSNDAEAMAAVERLFADPGAGAKLISGLKAVPGGALQTMGSGLRGVAIGAEITAAEGVASDIPLAEKMITKLAEAERTGTITPENRTKLIADIRLEVLKETGADDAAGYLLDIGARIAGGESGEAILSELQAEEAAVKEAPDRLFYKAGEATANTFREALAPAPGTEESLPVLFGNAIGSMAGFMGASAVSALLGTGPAGTVAFAGATGIDEAYQRARQNGVPHDKALTYALQGSVPGAIQAISVEFLMRKLVGPARRRFGVVARDIAVTAGAEAAVETMGAVMQNMIEQQYNPSKGTWDGTLVQGVMAGSAAAALRGLLYAFGPFRRTIFRDVERMETSAQVEQTFEALRQGLEGNALREAVPERFRNWAETVTKGTPAETVYVSAEGLQELAQNVTDPKQLDEILAALPGVSRAEFDAAVADGTDMAIPMSTWMTDIVGTPFDEMLVKHVRLDPAQLTATERVQLAGTVMQEVADATAAGDKATKDQKDVVDVFEETLSQLAKQTNMTRQAAEFVAAQYTAFYKRAAQRAGVPLDQFVQQNPLARVRLEGADTDLDLGDLSANRPLEPLLAEVRSGSAERSPEAGTLAKVAEKLGIDIGDASPVEIAGLLRAADRSSLTEEEQQFLSETLGDGFEGGPTPDILPQAPFRKGLINLAQMGVAAQVDTIPGLETASPGRVPGVRELATRYMRTAGLPIRHQAEYVKVDVERAKEIARLYDEAVDSPADPEVKAAYAALAKETVAQYEALLELGMTFEWITGDDPYSSPADAIRDMQENRHLWVFPTTSGFGTVNEAASDNALLQPTKHVVDGRVALVNDLFRIVHDVFGHGSEGASFGPRGEENAWQAHVRMFSPLAARAMTSETRGQNSWVNYGPFGEQNRRDPKNTVFADQKNVLLPEWVSTVGQADDKPAPNDAPVTDFSELNEDFLSRPGWYIITGTVEAEGDWTSPSNVERNQKVRSWLERKGFPYLEITGRYDGIDQGPSFLVLDATPRAAQFAAGLFDQDTALTHEGLVAPGRGTQTIPATGVVHFGDAARKLPFYSETNDGGIAFSVDLDFNHIANMAVIPAGYVRRDDRPQLPIRQSDGLVELHHWSNKQRDRIDPKYAGTGPVNGAERRSGARLSFFGINPRESTMEPGTGYVKEMGLGPIHHVVAVDPARLYPWFEDPDNLKSMLDPMERLNRTAYERLIKKAGYLGYYVTDDGTGSAPLGNAAALFKAVEPEAVLDDDSGEVLFQNGASTLIREDGGPWLPGAPRASMEEFGLPAKGKINLRDLAAAFDKRAGELGYQLDMKDFSAMAQEQIASAMADEVMYEVNQARRGAKTALGWYTTRFQEALDIMSKQFPELMEGYAENSDDPVGVQRLMFSGPYAARSYFTMLFAITSDGAAVKENLKNAAALYEAFRQTGELPTDFTFGGKANKAMRQNADLINRLYAEHGNVLSSYLLMEMPAAEAVKLLKQHGFEVTSKMPAGAVLPVSAVVFGPKLGSFYANLMGSDGYLTMDRWFMRTVNRLRGHLIPDVSGMGKRTTNTKGEKIGLAKFKESIGKPGIGDTEALELVRGYAKAYELKGYKNGTDIEKAANTIYKAAFIMLRDAPAGAKERGFLIDTVKRTRDMLRSRGIEMTVADIQAALWYYEKRLFAEIGVRASGDIDYADAARRHTGRSTAGEGLDGVGEQLPGETFGFADIHSEFDGLVADALWRSQTRTGLRAQLGVDGEADDLVLYQSPPAAKSWYYSALTRAVANAKQVQAPAKDWIAIIGKMPGVTRREITWTGVVDWLEAQTGQVRRDDLEAYLRAQELEIIELEAPGEFEQYIEKGNYSLYRERLLTIPNLHNIGPNESASKMIFVRSSHFRDPNVVVHTRETVRERGGKMVLFVEEVQSDLVSDWRKYLDQFGTTEEEVTTATRPYQRALMAARRARSAADEAGFARTEAKMALEQHFIDAYGDEIRANPLAQGFDRSSRVLVAPVRVLIDAPTLGGIEASAMGTFGFGGDTTPEEQQFVDEIAERAKFFEGLALRTKEGRALLEAAQAAAAERQRLMAPAQEAEQELARASERFEDAVGGSGSELQSLPHAPFDSEQVYGVALKRILNDIANTPNIDALAWTPGYMQAERWSGAVQAVVQRIDWSRRSDGFTEVDLRTNGGSERLAVSLSGTISEATGRLRRSEGRQLAELIGSAQAERVLAEETGFIDGQRIVIGGDGYTIAYDQTMRRFIEKWAKKHGGKLELSEDVLSVPAKQMLEQAYNALRRAASNRTITRDEIYERARHALALADIDPLWASNDRRSLAEAFVARVEQEDLVHPTTGIRLLADFANIVNEYLFSRHSDETLERMAKTLNGGDADPARPVWYIEVTPEMRAAAAEPQPLFQSNRGRIVLPPRGQGKAPLITLFSGHDLSTILHEMGHQYLYIFEGQAKDPGASAELKADFETVKRWWGQNAAGVAKDAKDNTGVEVTPADVTTYLQTGSTGDGALDRAISVGLQEQWARGFERYLFEGRAPSQGLARAFRAFKSWLISVYVSVKKLNVELSPEVREVFDRLFATNEEIAMARDMSRATMLAAKTAEEMGIDEASFQRLVGLQEQALAEAEQKLMADIMRPIRQARAAENAKIRAEVHAEVEERVRTSPVNRLRAWLTNGQWWGADAPPDLPQGLRLDRGQLIERYGEQFLRLLPRGRYPVYSRMGEDGADLDDVAGWFGFGSGDDMVQQLKNSTKAEDQIEAEVQQIMLERFPDPVQDGEIEDAAVEALHSDKAGELLVAEMHAIVKGGGAKGKVTPRRVMAEIARRTIDAMPVRKAIQSHVWQEGERRASVEAQDALARGDRQAAFDAKRRQLQNHMLYSQSRAVVRDMEQLENTAKRLSRRAARANLAPDYIAAIDDILTTYEFRKVSGKELDRRGALRAYVEKMKAEGRENELAIPDEVLEQKDTVNYRELSVQHLRGVLDSLVNLEHTARFKKKLLDRKAQRDLDETVDTILSAFFENVPGRKRGRVATDSDRRRRSVRQYLNLILNATTILRKIDGQQDMGPAFAALKAPMDEATRDLTQRSQDMAAALDRLYGAYGRSEQRRMSVRKRYQEVEADLSKWDIISIALNMGNADNLERLTNRDAGGFTRQQVDRLVETLDKRDWDFVQGMWDLINSYWPEIEARERRLTGVAPRKVEAMPVQTKFGSYRGGYYPIVYDDELSGSVTDEKDAELMKNIMPGRFGKAQTANGHLKERKLGSGGRILALGIDVAHRHLQRVIHDLAYSETVTSTWRILQDARLRAAFVDAGLLEDLRTLELWVQDVASGQLAAGDLVSRTSRRLKTNFTMMQLGFNLQTVALQITGLPQASVTIGHKKFFKGLLTYTTHPVSTTQEVFSRSKFMTNRQTTFQKDIYDIVGDVGKGPLEGAYQSTLRRYIAPLAFALMQKVQFYAVDVPIWIAVYQADIEAGVSEHDAVIAADSAVVRAQAGGEFADRSAIERGTLSPSIRQSEFIRLFTALGSYMFAKFNVAYERSVRAGRTIRTADSKAQAGVEALKYVNDMVLLFVIEALAYAAIRGMLPGQDEDDEDQADVADWAKFIASEGALSVVATMPFIRDVAGAVKGFGGGGAYGGIAETVARPITETLRAATEGEARLAWVKSLVSGLGLATGLPAAQTNRVIDAIWRIGDGEEVSPLEFAITRR